MNQSVSSILSWCSTLSWRDWAIIAAGILLFVLILILLLRPVFTRRKIKQMNQQASAQQQQDLQAWQNIATMAKDPDNRVKQSLSSQLKPIRTLFQQGMEMLRKSGRNRNSLPWFMMLGEPQSGKSELLKTVDLSLKCSATENEEETSLPLRFWLGRALVLDISGRTFFDRWFNGSCAEWGYIRKLLLKFHHKVPLNGIILTVPADALIADSEELTRKKLSLIAAELNSFLSGIGMILPCYVVVTKLDMILGFREYFQKCTDQQTEKIFGWRNPEKNGCFDAEAFAAYFNGLQEKLHDISLSRMLPANDEKVRMDLTSGIYLFPDEFARIRRNLVLYLNTLFGRRSWIDSDCAKIAGVYFTAARCGHVMLSPEYAESLEKPVEEATLINKQAGPQHAFFVKDLFDDLIFANGKCFAFTHAGRIRRNIKKYVLCLLMAAAAVWFALTAWNSQGQIQASLAERSIYYDKTASYLNQGNLRQSPLVVVTPKGKTAVSQQESLAGYPDVNRLMYFYESQQTPDKTTRIPWGFRLSQLLLFHDFDCDQTQQDFVSSRIQMEMVLRPTLEILLRHLVSPQADKEPFEAAKRDVFLQLHQLKNLLPDEQGRSVTSDLLTAPYLRYLNPGFAEELVDLLSYRAGKTSTGDLSVVARIVYSLEYQKALRALTRQFLNAWEQLMVEPNGNYGMLRTAIRNGSLIRQNMGTIRQLGKESAGSKDPKQVMLRLVSLIDQQNKLADTLAPALASPQLMGVLQTKTADTPKGPKPTIPVTITKRAMTFQDIFAKYKAQMEKDFELIRRNGSAAAFGKFSNSASVDADMLEKTHQSVRRKLALEEKELEDKLAELKNAQFFQPALTGQKNESVQDTALVMQVELEYLNMLVHTWKLPNPPMKSPLEFSQRLQTVREEQARQDKALADYATRYASNKIIADFVKDCRNFIQLSGREMNNRLMRELFALYPMSAELLMSEIAKQSHLSPETLGMKAELAGESFAALKLNNSFAPQTALAYAAPIGMLLAEAKGKKDAASQPDPELTRIAKILDEYFDKYIQYWGNYCDAIPVGFDSWTAFRSDSMKRKAYETNTLLLAGYRSSCEFISQIPDAVLSQATANRKKLAVTLLNNRIQMLSTDFMQSCNHVCGAWAALPADANKAFGILNGLPQKQLRSDYLLVFDAKAKGDIPWWSKWVSSGVSLLFRDAKAQLFKDFDRYRPMIFSFPLCARSPYPAALSGAELAELSGYLAALGCPVPQTAPEPAAGKTPAKTDKKPDASKSLTPPDALEHFFGNRPESLKEWTSLGGRVQIIIDALTNRVKPLVYTLSIPSELEQKNLSARLEKSLPLAIYRFPYIRVSNQPDAANAKMIFLDGRAVPELVTGTASDSQIRLEFSSFSDSAKPDCTIAINSDWAIFRLYLSEHSCLDPKTRKVYSALTLRDKFGKSFLLWLEFKFNKVLPLPSEWPSPDNCPDFSQIQSKIRQSVNTAPNWMQMIQTAGTGEKGYRQLSQAIRQHSVKTFPVCSIEVSDTMQSAMLETPYFEVATPEEAKRVFYSGKTQHIPLDLSANRLDIRLFRFSDGAVPAYSCTIPGPYALLRLLTADQRKFDKSFLLVPMTLTSKDGKKTSKLMLKIRLGR